MKILDNTSEVPFAIHCSAFQEFALLRLVFGGKSYAEVHENPTNPFVANMTSQTESRGIQIRRSLYFIKETS